MIKKFKTLASLITASISAQADYQTDLNVLKVNDNSKDFEALTQKASVMNLHISNYLAAHRSHSSHSSHSSHRSSSGGSYSGYSTPSYSKPSYSTPSYSKPSSASNNSKKSSLITSEMKRICTVKGGENTWDFSKDEASCKINGTYVNYKNLSKLSKSSDPLGKSSRISGSIPNKSNSNLNLKRQEVIKKVQLVLFLDGLYNGNIDGIMGKGTKNAINQFKKKHNITNSSYLGIETLNALGVKGF